MSIKTKLLNLCMVMLIPLTAAAKQPEPGACEVLFDGAVPGEPFYVSAGSAFDVTVKQLPAEGQWFVPTVSVEMSVPLDEPNSSPANPLTPGAYSQVVIQTFNSLGPDSAKATFIIPVWLINIQPGGAAVTVTATVSEPVNRGKSRETLCEAVAILI